jgi:hypothetical protein
LKSKGWIVRILLALIHNNNPKRIESARQSAKFLLSEVGKLDGVIVDYMEASKQEAFSRISVKLWQRVRRLSNFSQYRYLRYYLQSPARRWLPLLGAVFIDGIRFTGAVQRSKISVEHAVTQKHLQVFAAGMHHDFIFVIEDDAVIESNSAQTGETIRLLLEAASKEVSSLTYIDFAGGFDLTEVAPDSVFLNESESYVTSNKLFTNTACGYALSSNLAKKVLSEVSKNHLLSWVGIDFLLNRVFHDYGLTGSANCYHLTRSSIGHGSMNGIYSSWERSIR